MKKKLLKTGIVSILFVALLLGGYSCADDNLSELEVRRMIEQALKDNNQNLEFTDGKVIQYEIKKDDWTWIDEAGRYEVVADLPDLDNFVYEFGAVLGYVFIGKQGEGEVQKVLPYIETYLERDEKGNITNKYTETLSYDVEYADIGKSTVAFFIQNSELVETDNFLSDYYFRIVMIW